MSAAVVVVLVTVVVLAGSMMRVHRSTLARLAEVEGRMRAEVRATRLLLTELPPDLPAARPPLLLIRGGLGTDRAGAGRALI